MRQFDGHHDLYPLGHADIELSEARTADTIAALRPHVIVHAGAMTNVDGCARDPEAAYAANALGSRWVAQAAVRSNARMVYISTNEVFDGTATTPYGEFDRPNPINAYARSKYAGEQAARELVDRLYVVRVAWLFGGTRNFVRTVLRLSGEQPSLRMVDDEIGSPTHAGDVAVALGQLLTTDAYGTYHFVNQGSCSRYELAATVLAAAGRATVTLEPMKLADFVRPSRVPLYTALNNYVGAAQGITFRPWQDATHAFVRSIIEGQA
jgi:dTDP-4-dehydrorhamnose reductase